ncbi:hypothetical protein KUCAC02_032487 [Chaenocephalus aceratus]|nr:hypothetical protein KUCAC02_032487 [Chaenocephalus aceratus]
MADARKDVFSWTDDEAQYPTTDTGKDFPHGVGAITKAQLAAKLKQIRMKSRRAVGSGRRGGLLQVQLNGPRSDRLRRKRPADRAVQEDLRLRRRMVELMEQTSIRNADSFQQLNESIREGFSLMRESTRAPPHRSPQPADTPHLHTMTSDPPRQPSQFSARQALFPEDYYV